MLITNIRFCRLVVFNMKWCIDHCFFSFLFILLDWYEHLKYHFMCTQASRSFAATFKILRSTAAFFKIKNKKNKNGSMFLIQQPRQHGQVTTSKFIVIPSVFLANHMTRKRPHVLVDLLILCFAFQPKIWSSRIASDLYPACLNAVNTNKPSKLSSPELRAGSGLLGQVSWKITCLHRKFRWLCEF